MDSSLAEIEPISKLINSLFSFSRQKQKDVNIHRLFLSLSCRLYHVHFYYFFCFCYRHNHHRRHETFPPCYLVIINIITIMIVTVITAFLKTLFFPCEKFFVLFLTRSQYIVSYFTYIILTDNFHGKRSHKGGHH